MPLWGLAHLDSDGEGMGQKTAHGYLFMLNVLFRPALMVLGFLIAGAGIIVMGSFVHNIYGVVMASIQADGSATGSFTGLVSMLAFIIIYAVLMNSVIHGCFNAIHVVPDQVLAWVGGHASGAQFGREVASNSGSAIVGVMRANKGGMPLPKDTGSPEMGKGRDVGPTPATGGGQK